MKIATWIAIMITFHFSVLAQKKETTFQSLYWTRYYNQLTINEKLTWHNEIDNRTFFQNNRHHHFIMHSRLHRKLSKNMDVAFGITYSLQSPQDPNSNSTLIIPEIRPHQEINYVNSINKRWSIQQRFRLDERFFRRNNGTELMDGFDFNVRFRYRVQVNYKLSKPENLKPTTLKIADELMLNAGKNIVYNQFDQNRVYLAVEQVFNKNFSFELGYMNWYQQRALGYQFFKRDIFRLTLYHKIKL